MVCIWITFSWLMLDNLSNSDVRYTIEVIKTTCAETLYSFSTTLSSFLLINVQIQSANVLMINTTPHDDVKVLLPSYPSILLLMPSSFTSFPIITPPSLPSFTPKFSYPTLPLLSLLLPPLNPPLFTSSISLRHCPIIYYP